MRGLGRYVLTQRVLAAVLAFTLSVSCSQTGESSDEQIKVIMLRNGCDVTQAKFIENVSARIYNPDMEGLEINIGGKPYRFSSLTGKDFPEIEKNANGKDQDLVTVTGWIVERGECVVHRSPTFIAKSLVWSQ